MERMRKREGESGKNRGREGEKESLRGGKTDGELAKVQLIRRSNYSGWASV